MRTLRTNRYIAAIVITFVIFVLGFILGAATSERKILEIEQLSRQQEADFSSLQFQFSYLENVPVEESCVVLSRTLESNLKTLGPSLKKMEGYEASGDTKNPDYVLLKRKYTIANLRYWLLAEKAYYLIQQHRMRDINKAVLKAALEKSGDTNLYQFIKAYVTPSHSSTNANLYNP